MVAQSLRLRATGGMPLTMHVASSAVTECNEPKGEGIVKFFLSLGCMFTVIFGCIIIA